jgi:hypothetical protein
MPLTIPQTRAGLSRSRTDARKLAWTFAMSKAAGIPLPETSAMQMASLLPSSRNTSK